MLQIHLKARLYYRILMVWEAFFIQILSLLLIILLIFLKDILHHTTLFS